MALSKGRPKGSKNKPRSFEYRVGVLVKTKTRRAPEGELVWVFYYFQTRGRAENRLKRSTGLEAPAILQSRHVSPWVPYEYAKAQGWGV